MPEQMATDAQRWEIAELFAGFGVTDMRQVRADAERILMIDYLPDLRELTSGQADELISELRRAVAARRVSDT
jgi:bacterioferritin (cytochrome b1)